MLREEDLKNSSNIEEKLGTVTRQMLISYLVPVRKNYKKEGGVFFAEIIANVSKIHIFGDLNIHILKYIY